MNHGLSLNDFYVHNGTKLGNIHAHPIVTAGELMAFMRQNTKGLNRLPKALISKIVPRALISKIASMGASLGDSWTMFAGIVEDLPYPGNHVAAKTASDEDIVYTYRYPDELRRRSLMMRDGFKSAVEPHFEVRPLQPAGTLNGSHVGGTCRFGDDPRSSVLDRDNRAHDPANLYILAIRV